MKLFRVLLLFVGATAVAVAQTNSPGPQATQQPAQLTARQTRPISLQDCIQQALERNLDLQIERYNPQVALYGVRAAYGAYDPTFSVSGQHDYSETRGSFDPDLNLTLPGSIIKSDGFNSGLDGYLPSGLTYGLFGGLTESLAANGTNSLRSTRGSAGVNATQPLLKNFWIDNTRLTIRVRKNRLKFSESGLVFKITDIVTKAEDAYYDLIAARENVKVREKALELSERLLSENKKRVEVGALAPLDEKQAASQVATAHADLLSARQTLASQQNVLKLLITDDYRVLHDLELEPAESLAAPFQIYNLQDSWGKGMTLRGDLQQVRFDLEQSGIQLKYDRNQLFPQLDLFGTYGYAAGGGGTATISDGFDDIQRRDQPFYTYGASFSTPLSIKSARNNYKASKATVQQRLLDVKKLEQDILGQIDDAIIAAQVGYERVDATRAAREYAEAALEAEQKKLESGKSTSFVVLQLQRDLTDARSQEIGALADYNKALADLAFREGSTLERHAIDMKAK